MRATGYAAQAPSHGLRRSAGDSPARPPHGVCEIPEALRHRTGRGEGSRVLAEFTGVLVIFVIAFVLAGALLGIHLLVGPKREFAAKQEPFECGEEQIVSPRQRYAVKFYLVAILFVVFDVEAIYFYPWGATFQETGLIGLAVMAIFTVPLAVGLIYEWSKGALEW